MGIYTVSMLATDQDRAEAFYQNLLAAAFDAVRLIRFPVKQGIRGRGSGDGFAEDSRHHLNAKSLIST